LKYLLVSTALCAGLASCRAEQQTPSSDVAVVDGQPITAVELDEAIAQPLAQLDTQLYSLRRQKLDELIGSRLIAAEAKKRGLSVAQLLEAEVEAHVRITETEVTALVDANKARWTGTPDELREQVRSELRRQRQNTGRRMLIERLSADANITSLLPLPKPYPLQIPIEGAAAVRGPASAPVTIVEFTDFHCPYCRAAQSTLAEIERRYGQHVRFVQHDLPIEQIHPNARAIHEAARCAAEQGKFWEFRERVFALAPASTGQVPSVAKELNLDVQRFDVCRSGPAVRAAVQRDVELGGRLGIASTPTFFINGRQVMGAQPLDEFVPYIEHELRLAGVDDIEVRR